MPFFLRAAKFPKSAKCIRISVAVILVFAKMDKYPDELENARENKLSVVIPANALSCSVLLAVGNVSEEKTEKLFKGENAVEFSRVPSHFMPLLDTDLKRPKPLQGRGTSSECLERKS